MISYRFGYGRGWPFILKNWFALLAVPLTMIALFAVAFFKFDFDLGTVVVGRDLLGKEIISASIWIMYFTVGWHYAKQVFGCLMVYAKLRGYSFTAAERLLIKWNLFAVAIYQFQYLNSMLVKSGATYDPRFPGILISGFDLPAWFGTGLTLLLAVFTLATVTAMARAFLRMRVKPDVNFAICYVSFLVWWVPVANLPEFYAMAVPFFHSLQYLIFAAKVEESEIRRSKTPTMRMALVVSLTFLAGFAAFELVPSALDVYLETSVGQSAWFFMAVFAVFINIHHFFIDSVAWKLGHPEVSQALFGKK